MLPTIPAESAREPLLHKAALLTPKSLTLQGSPVLPEALTESLQAMNSYGSNKNEGPHELRTDHFTQKGNACTLSKAGRQLFTKTVKRRQRGWRKLCQHYIHNDALLNDCLSQL